MNKVFILFFGLVLLVCLTVGTENEGSQSLAEPSNSVRTARDAEAGKKKAPKKQLKKRKRKNSVRRRKNMKPGQKKGKKGIKRTKGKKGMKRTKGKRGKKSKKGKRGNKGKKPSNKQRGNKQGKNMAETEEEMADCFTSALKYMTQMQKIVSNYERQRKRAVKHSDLMFKKNSKSDKFENVSKLLVSAGGGQKENLSCGGEYGNTGATTLINLAKNLSACPASVNASCGNHTWVPLDPTIVDMCSMLVEEFSAAVETCKEASRSGADCECWGGDSLAEMSGKLSDCGYDNVKSRQQSITDQKNRCTETFKVCKDAEDDSVTALAVCSTSTSDLKAKANTLSANNASASAALAKIKELAGSSRFRNSKTKRATAASCAEVITKSTTLIAVITKSTSDSSITTISVEISSSTVTCSTEEKTKLSTAATSLETAVASIVADLAAVQEQLQALTGSTAAPFPDITTKAARRHRERNFRF